MLYGSAFGPMRDPKCARAARGVGLGVALACAVASACSSQSSSDGVAQDGSASAETSWTPCEYSVLATSSERIPTVGVVEWTVDLPSVEAASIEFGLDTTYGMAAPVDLTQPGYRTLLLGMKPSREYHARIVASAGGERCASEDFTLETGPLRNDLPVVDVLTPLPDARAGGFIVASVWTDGKAVILDSDGDYVWWYPTGDGDEPRGIGGPDVSRARMAYDGKSVWLRNVNVGGGASLVRRVSMEGELLAELTVPDGHHDLAVLPHDSVAYIVHVGTCDVIVEQDAAGNLTQIFDVRDAVDSRLYDCHSNSLHYNVEDDTYTLSSLNYDQYTKFTRGGEIVWRLGGEQSSFTGSGAAWDRQHGHHNLPGGHILIFNNGAFNSPSGVFEVALDTIAGTAERVWQYENNGLGSSVLGDVQRLPNGNTLVTYSDAGTIREVAADGALVQDLSMSVGNAFGYADHRMSLYGPPDR